MGREMDAFESFFHGVNMYAERDTWEGRWTRLKVFSMG